MIYLSEESSLKELVLAEQDSLFPFSILARPGWCEVLECATH